MRRIFSIFAVVVLVISGGATVFAQTGTAVNAAYWKSSDKYDVVVHDNSGAKLKLYVNDKNPTASTANKKGWATFRKVKLNNNGKLSFTRVVKASNGKTSERPINYTRTFTVNGHAVSFKPPVVAKPVAAAPAPVAEIPKPAQSTNMGVGDTNLSNNNTYTNSNGETVHSPAVTTDGNIPAGATAQCQDGTYSFSQSRRGTCSGHGGVGSWL